MQDADSWKEAREKVFQGIRQHSKQEDIRVARLEEQVRRLQSSESSSSSCWTCTRATHADGKCPGRKLECFTCGLLGHLKGSAACNRKKKAGGKKKKEKASQVDESLTDSIGRIVEVVRATGDTFKSKTAKVHMKV